MTITNFKQQVANFMNRSLAALTSDNSQDMLLACMNDVRRAAQRAHTFELNRTEDAYLSTSVIGANWQTGCKTTPGGATAVLMKRVDEVWNYSTLSLSAGTAYVRVGPKIPYGYSGQFKREFSTEWPTPVIQNSQQLTVQNRFAYTIGSNLYVTTVEEATIFKLVGVKWLDDLTGSEDPDIFLTYFTDWFRYATIAALNVYLKDSERFPIDMTVMDQLWQSVKTMDGEIANQGESVDLD